MSEANNMKQTEALSVKDTLKLALECAERCEAIDGMYSWSATITAIKEVLVSDTDGEQPEQRSVSEHLEPVPAAMKTVIEAMQQDPDYAWGWHCNIAMSFVDAGGDHYTGNQGAARFMRTLANVEPAHELPSPPPQYKETEQEPVAWIHTKLDGVVVSHRPVDLSRHPDRWEALYKTPQPCPTCEALARTVMLDQTSHDTTPYVATPRPQRKPLTDEQFLELLLRKGTQELVGLTTFVSGSIQTHGRIGLLRSAKIIKEFVEAAHGIKEKNT